MENKLISAAPDLYTAHVLRDELAIWHKDRSNAERFIALLESLGWVGDVQTNIWPTAFIKDYTERAMQKARGEKNG